MKYVIVTMTRGAIGENHMKYPGVYNAEEVERKKKGAIVYEGAFSRGEATEECLLFLQDALADTYALDADIRIVTEAQADTWLAANQQIQDAPDVQVLDPNQLALVQVKQAGGIPLDENDLRALDPDDDRPGVNRTKKTVRRIFG